MQLTLLGSGEALGMPAPLCDCAYCLESDERRRPGLLAQTDEATVVLDVSPDVRAQLHRAGATDVDAFFVTHHHFDHVGGVDDLHHAAMAFEEHVLDTDPFDRAETPPAATFDLFLSPTALLHLSYAKAHLAQRLAPDLLEHGEPVEVGDLEVVPFPVDHARPLFDTLGFAVSHGDSKVVYAPDVRTFLPEWEAGREYEDADLLFVEGAALFRAEGHGTEAELRAAIADADADRTVLVNISEHLQRLSTDELEAMAAEQGYELGRDFAEYRLPG